MSTSFYKIDFLGGPFDGYAYAASRPPVKQRLVLPVDRNIGPGFITNQQVIIAARPTSLAVYELRNAQEGWAYQFIKAIPPFPTR